MLTTVETWDLSQQLTPVKSPEQAVIDAAAWGPNLSVTKGQSVGVSTADKKCYPLGSGAAVNETQNVTTTGTTSAGTFVIYINGIETGPIAYNGSIANVQTALDAAFGASQIVAGGGNINALALVFSGSNYTGATQPLVTIIDNRTGVTKVAITRQTVGGLTGTQNWMGFSKFTFTTDASGNVFYAPNAVSNWRQSAHPTSPIYVSGTFAPSDVSTGTTVAATATLTGGGTVAIGDQFSVTVTNSALIGTSLTFTTTAGTVANLLAGIANLINLSPEPAFQAVTAAVVGSTVVVTAKNGGVPFTISAAVVTSASGTWSVTGTTAASGISIATIQATVAGARILADGNWLIPG